jgi:hypothetical protein
MYEANLVAGAMRNPALRITVARTRLNRQRIAAFTAAVRADCMQENGKAEEISTVEFTDDGLYEATCPKGHKSITILQQRKFEILFDIGIYAINDGYYREAISSFTASLES